MREPAKFGTGASCSYVPPYRVGRSYQAWVQCDRWEVQICSTKGQQEQEYKTCTDRPRATKDEEAQKRAEALKRANDARDTYETALQKYHDLTSFIDSPREFLRAKLEESAAKRIFPEGPKPTKGDRADLGQEVYRYAMNQAKAGISLTPNPIIQSIQSEQLKRIAAEFENTFAQLDAVALSIQRFGQTDLGSAKPVGPRQGIPIGSAVPVADPECKIFSDPGASALLLQRDEARWRTLTERCI